MTAAPDPSRDLAVVVPSRDRPELLAGCLAALRVSNVPPARVLVVDSASSDPSSVAAVAGGATILRCDLPGASRARNVGWRAAVEPIVAFVDDDIRVAPDWTVRVCAPFADRDVVLVTGKVAAGEPVPGAAVDVEAVALTDDVAAGPFDRTTTGNVGASANVAARRSALEAEGGFDEALGAGARFRAAEDIDLFRRVLAHGSGWHAADAVGRHDQWRGRRALMRLEADYGFGFGVHLAKVVRADPALAGRVVGYEVRRYGRDLVHDLRGPYRLGVLRRSLWALSSLVGFGRGLAVPVRDGHLATRG